MSCSSLSMMCNLPASIFVDGVSGMISDHCPATCGKCKAARGWDALAVVDKMAREIEEMKRARYGRRLAGLFGSGFKYARAMGLTFDKMAREIEEMKRARYG